MACFIAKKVKISQYTCMFLLYTWIDPCCCYRNVATSIVAVDRLSSTSKGPLLPPSPSPPMCEQFSGGFVAILVTSPRLLPAPVNNNEDEDDNFDSSDDEIMNTRRGNRPSNYLSRLPPPFQHHSKQTFSIAITTSSTTTSSSMTLTPTRINNRKNGSTVTTMTMSMTSMLPPKFTTTGSYAFTHDVWAIHQWRYACCHCHYTMKYVTQPI